MNDKITNLSSIIVNYSLKVKPQEKVLIIVDSLETKELVKCLINDIFKNRAYPFVKILDQEINSIINEKLQENMLETIINCKYFEVNNYDSFITIKYTQNEYENKNMNQDMNKKLIINSMNVDDIRINKRKWVLLNYPSPFDAYKAKMTTQEFYNYAFDAMTIDYKELENRLMPLKELMEKTDKVRITGKNTDLTFSIKGIPSIICAGESNIPDGEIFTAPIKTSVNGYITYNTKSFYHGTMYSNIKLVFKDGKIIEATSDEGTDKLKKIFETDEGSSYIGEFSLGVNNKIQKEMGDILYDEKISGSIHLTPGRAYEEANNQNTSSIHWDLVLIQKEEYGGGNIYFDDVLIRENGIFVLDTLKSLNEKM